MRKRNDKRRILTALKQHPGGISAISFAAPDVIDGGEPIGRVAARICELRAEGHKIVNAGWAGRNQRSRLYKLEQDVGGGPAEDVEATDASAQGVADGPAAGTLFDLGAQDVPKPSSAILGAEGRAA